MVTVVALLATASAVEAQVGLGAQGGVAFPQGDNMDGLAAGWHADGTLSFDPALLPVGVRVEGGYATMGTDEDEALFEGDYQQLHLIGNAILSMPIPGLTPYLIGGVGYYRDRIELEDSDVETEWEDNAGANIGVGLDLPLPVLDVYVETRFHHIFGEDSRQMIPVSVGLRF
ncbi:MAG: hypothetical protein ACRDFY_05790 [Candidatus Limnocylindria bacterium]